MSGIVDILYVRFQVPDLDQQETFLNDFGFATFREEGTLYARGTDANPFVYAAQEGDAQFLGLGFEAESSDDLERIAAIDGVEIPAIDMIARHKNLAIFDP